MCHISPVWSWTWTAEHRGWRSRPPGQTTALTTASPWQHCRPVSGRTVSALTLRTWLNRTRTKPDKSADSSALCCQAASERLFRLQTALPMDSFRVKSAAGRAFIVSVSTDWEGGANFVSFNIFLCLHKALWFDFWNGDGNLTIIPAYFQSSSIYLFYSFYLEEV